MNRLTIEEAQRRVHQFLTLDMVEALRSVEYEAPPLSDWPADVRLSDQHRAVVTFSNVDGASDCLYRIAAFGDAMIMRLQLNVRRFVVVYQVPADAPGGDLAATRIDSDTVAGHFERWAIGARHAGWQIGWRDGTDPWRPDRRAVETYCYAMLAEDFLDNPLEQLYWRTDIVQMTRAFMLDSRRMGIRLEAPERIP